MTRRAWRVTVFLAAGFALADRSAAQSVADKLKAAAKAARDSLAKAGNNALSASASRALGVSLAGVADGHFTATLAPWVQSDSGGEASAVRFDGSAVAAPAGFAFRVQLCDNSGARPWTAILLVPGTLTGGHVLATAKQYTLPGNGISVVVVAPNATAGAASSGTLTIGSVTATAFGGSGKIEFARAVLTGTREPQPVQLDLTFRAHVVQRGEVAPACAVRSIAAAPAAAATTSPGASSSPPSQKPSVAEQIKHAVEAAPSRGFATGDTLRVVASATLTADARNGARALGTVKQNEDVVYAGRESNGFVYVRHGASVGWVKKALVVQR